MKINSFAYLVVEEGANYEGVFSVVFKKWHVKRRDAKKKITETMQTEHKISISNLHFYLFQPDLLITML